MRLAANRSTAPTSGGECTPKPALPPTSQGWHRVGKAPPPPTDTAEAGLEFFQPCPVLSWMGWGMGTQPAPTTITPAWHWNPTWVCPMLLLEPGWDHPSPALSSAEGL